MSAIFLRTVSVTLEPKSKAPRNSKIPATMTACVSVSALAPTEVAKAFATSLAPIPYAVKKARNAPITTIHTYSVHILESKDLSGLFFRYRPSYLLSKISYGLLRRIYSLTRRFLMNIPLLVTLSYLYV